MTTQNANSGQLVLFTPSTEIADYFTPRELKDRNGAVTGHSFGVIKRKDLASMKEIDPRKQSALLDREMLKVTDEAKRQMANLAVSISQSPDWTGARLTIRKSPKTGLRSATMGFKEVKRDEVVLTAEQIAEVTGETVEQVKARMAEQAKKKAAATVDIQVTQTPSLPNAAAPVTQAAKSAK